MLRLTVKILLSTLFLFNIEINAQDTLQIIESKVFACPNIISADRYGNIYMANEYGVVEKFSNDLTPLLKLSPPKPISITGLEAWNTVNIFVFSSEYQSVSFYDRFLGSPNNCSINNQAIGFAKLCCPSSDNSIWIIDENDFSLKKWDCRFSKILQNNPLDLILDNKEYELNELKEYQNNLYLTNKNKFVLQFDIWGNLKRKFMINETENIHFYKDYLYYATKTGIIFENLYLMENKIINYNKNLDIKQLIIVEDKVYLFEKNTVHICKINLK